MESSLSRRHVLAASAAGATLFGLAACGNSDSSSGSSDRDPSEITDQTVRVWFMEGSISDESTKALVDAFAKKFPGNTLSVEVQPWDGIVSKLQTSLASKSESPDLVETGNTQSNTFTTVGAFADISDLLPDLGGDKLIQSFVDAGAVDGKNYAVPLYAGARGLFYRKDLMKKAGIDVPTTIDELKKAAIDLGDANPADTKGFSGIYLAAVDIHGVESLLFAAGGEYASGSGESWTSEIAGDASVSALETISEIFSDGTAYALDSAAAQKSFEKYFNDEKVGMLIATGNIGTKIDKKLWDADKVGVMALPGLHEGEIGATFAGGSNISIAQNAQNPELAREALKLIFAEDFQNHLAQDGWVPGNIDYGDKIPGAFGKISPEIVEASKLTPNTPQWGVAMGDNIVRDFYTKIAQGKDVKSTADEFSGQLDDVLNDK
ncbi:extracellular solute-binding protein [Brachybacterium kimchii]|uniref:Extracellular solute-binding protein n=1 Tax=Brachybacterium kimchii TaxID=2942909 RepID=A0ABY4N3C3_9MICO|nr:extracellular solute-binding protein [Brachybacterium kimchii]UQN28644.1 extracellular solute-binding protein [Brachybacterium kimchii]